ncbi:MAG: acyl-CoA dehydrogenase family protein [Dehalococcoidia bacterium]|nr:acyl-CoA dehydrogenase family protein [Dehalococcoidia bacterium]
MDFRLSSDEEAFREEVVSFLTQELSEDVRLEYEERGLPGPLYHAFLHKLGHRGWLTLTWPEEHGGLGRPPMYRFIMAEEMAKRGVEYRNVAESIVAPSLMLCGSPQQKERFLPLIASGEVVFTLLYSEPHAGSDLASLELWSSPEGDGFTLSGQKLFSSEADMAHYAWVASRTDPDVPKHRGISLFLVDMKTPGITVHPLISMAGDRRFNEVFLDNARVGRDALIGEENRGWYYVAAALDFERATAGAAMFIGNATYLVSRMIDYVNNNPWVLHSRPGLRSEISKRATELEVLRVLSYQVLSLMAGGHAPTYQASMVKLFGSELTQRLSGTAGAALGLYSQLGRASHRAPYEGELGLFYMRAVSDSIRGGTSEIQRNIIAIRGLGLTTQ